VMCMSPCPPCATRGTRGWSRSLFEGISIFTASGLADGGSSPAVPLTKPSRGSSSASGAVSRTLLPPGAARGRGGPRLVAVGRRRRVRERVELERAGQRQRRHDVGAGDERQRRGAAV